MCGFARVGKAEVCRCFPCVEMNKCISNPSCGISITFHLEALHLKYLDETRS